MGMEQIDVFDREDRPTGRTATKKTPLSPDEYRRITELWVRTPDGRYLIQQRSANKHYYPLMWYCTVSGSQNAGESPMDTALREAKEELGFHLQPQKAHFYQRITDDGIHFHVYLFLQEVDTEALVLEPMEVAAVDLATDEVIFQMIDEGRFISLPYYADFFAWAERIASD